MAIDWVKILRKEGYSSVKDMLKYFYVDKNMSTKRIASLLGISTPTITHLLKQEGISVRTRGGKNHIKGQTTL